MRVICGIRNFCANAFIITPIDALYILYGCTNAILTQFYFLGVCSLPFCNTLEMTMFFRVSSAGNCVLRCESNGVEWVCLCDSLVFVTFLLLELPQTVYSLPLATLHLLANIGSPVIGLSAGHRVRTGPPIRRQTRRAIKGHRRQCTQGVRAEGMLVESVWLVKCCFDVASCVFAGV